MFLTISQPPDLITELAIWHFNTKEGIVIETTEPYTSEINGPSERLCQTIYRKAAPILKYSRLDLKFWPEAVRHTGVRMVE
jgi:hypothetical protein